MFSLRYKGFYSIIINESVYKFKPNRILKIPMMEASRSLNLSNAASIIIYESWRQKKFE